MDLGKTFIFFLLFLALSSATSVVDFCVADLSLPIGPSGYPCKDPAKITVDDFVYSGLAVAGNMTNIFKAAVSVADDHTFPALNSLGLSAIRADLDVGGVFPLHSHRVSEFLIIIEGTVTAGFIGSDNKPYYKTLNKGDSMIIPQSLYHFVVNVGNTPALIFVSFNSQNPGIHTITTSIAANDLPIDVIQKVTLLDPPQIQSLKKIFGGKV